MGNPGIFIGIGGAGVKTLAHLKKKIRNGYDTQAEMLKENHFLFLDTDHNTIDAIRSIPEFQLDGHHPIPANEFIDLGDTNPYRLYEDAKGMRSEDNDRLLEWMIDQDLPKGFRLRRPNINRGAGAERMVGRTAIFKYRDLIANEIKCGIDKIYRYEGPLGFEPLRIEDVVKPAIWVFASSNGATGSSAILDLLYIIDREYQIRFDSEPYLRLVLFMPEEFRLMNPQNDNYLLNAHATFLELDAFKKDYIHADGRKFQHFAVKPDLKAWKSVEENPWPVYSYVLPIDTETEFGKKIQLNQLYSKTAEMCYLLHFGAIGDNVLSILDNDIRLLTRPTYMINDESWTRSAVAGGFKDLVKPNDEFKEYLINRFMYDLFDYGLLGFEFNEIHPDEKSQKLAKEQFANDYILKHLYNNGASDDNFEKYNVYDAVRLAKEEEKTLGVFGGEDEESLQDKFKTFLTSIEQIPININSNLNDSKHEWSRFSIIEKIQNDIYYAVEESIEKYGIKYTEHLLFQVDDKFLEYKIYIIENDILTKYGNEEYETKKNQAAAAIKNKSYSALNKACNDIKEFLREKTKLKVLKDILNQLCDERTGLLETIRKGPNGTGLASLRTLCEAKRNDYLTNLHDLAQKFKKTEFDGFTTYLPAISSFVATKGEGTWKDGHLFEALYGEIVPLDAAQKSKRKGNGDLGAPPIRSNSSSNQTSSLETIIKDIKKSGLSEKFFTVLATQGKLDVNKYSLEDFEQKAQEYILTRIDSVPGVKNWMSQTLEHCFKSEFESQKDANDFKDNFIEGVQLLYPSNSQEVYDTRFVFSGVSENFAELFGYDYKYTFIYDKNLTNRFMVFKFETGHSLRDYKYFEVNKFYYEIHKKDILNEKYGCHIHSAFCRLGIDEALKRV